MQLSSDVFDDSVQYLEHHQESLRIKKLIFCLCKKHWENDPNILNSLPLKDLILELIQIIPNRDQLKLSLYQLVKSLNRPKIYAAVAKVILEKVDYIYNDLNREPEIFQGEQGSQGNHIKDLDLILEKVIANLNNHQQAARIKKLLFAVSQNRWENNLDEINIYQLKNLLTDILQCYPTPRDLEIVFKKIIEKMNKRKLYLAISQVILTQLEDLYNNLPEAVDSEVQTTEISYGTQIIPLPNLPNTPQPPPQSHSSQDSPFGTSVIDITSEEIRTEIQQIKEVPPPPSKTYDLFELRLQIMQYTSPLQAKILLFSLIFHPWERSGQDWSMLRSYILDDLLDQVLQSGRSVAEIEAKLYTAAKSLADRDVYLQTASTILETLKPFL